MLCTLLFETVSTEQCVVISGVATLEIKVLLFSQLPGAK